MSSGHTHMLVGGVAGLGLARAIELSGYQLASSGVGRYSVIAVFIGASAILALLPDIDEQQSLIARRARVFITLATASIMTMMGWMLASPGTGLFPVQPLSAAVLGGLLGLGVIGPLLGWLILRMIRVGAGGHRRLTHSWIVAILFGIAAYCLWIGNQKVLAIIPGALTWAILIHDLGDLVTPDGLPLLYPLSSRRFGLPRPLSTFGEPLILVAAIVVSVVLVQGM